MRDKLGKPNRCFGMQTGTMILCGKRASKRIGTRWYCDECYARWERCLRKSND
jgi:hypothetical protein